MCRLLNDLSGALYFPHRNGIGNYEVITVVVRSGDASAEGGIIHHEPAFD